jgi:uncharacterized membrane protein HdeD (DUF308 family)
METNSPTTAKRHIDLNDQPRRPAGTWMTMLDGVLLILIGVVLVIPSQDAHDWLIRGLGLLLCAAALGVGARLWMASAARRYGPIAWIASIAPLVVGLILLIWPKESLDAITVTVGVVVLIRGVVETAIGLSVRPGKGWELWLLRGLVTIGLGIFFLAVMDWAAYLLLILLGIDLIVRGATGMSGHKLSGQ